MDDPEIPSEMEGERADVAVARLLGVTRIAARSALASGEVTIDGRRAKPGAKVAAGQRVGGSPVSVPDAVPAAEVVPLTARYEDDRVLVVSKPVGMVTHPSGGHPAGTLVNALLGHLGPAASGLERAGIVHRLDKDTSGLLLVAKDESALRALRAHMKERRIQRTYLALVRGRPPAPSGAVEAPVGRHPTRRRSMAVVDGGRWALTHYRTRAEGSGATLLEVDLETGRTHQIRVHLAHIGIPVVGDRTYGGVGEVSRTLGLDRPGLHAARLRFPHPDDDRLVVVDDPLPDDLVAALTRAGIHTLTPSSSTG